MLPNKKPKPSDAAKHEAVIKEICGRASRLFEMFSAMPVFPAMIELGRESAIAIPIMFPPHVVDAIIKGAFKANAKYAALVSEGLVNDDSTLGVGVPGWVLALE